MTGLGFLNSGTTGSFNSSASSVSASGQVVGVSTDALERQQAFLTGANGAGMTGLGFLNSGTTGSFDSHTWSVNASGRVVGSSSNANGLFEAFVTGENGVGMTGLGILNFEATGNDVFSVARGINASGQVVGDVFDRVLNREQAFPTGANGLRAIDDWLSEAGQTGWSITNAHAISDNGWIVARGRHATLTNGVPRALLIQLSSTTVPEPSTVALMAAGLIALGAAGRRRARASA